MTTIINEEQLEKFSRSADIAGHIVNEIPDMIEETDADLGVTVLVICGLLAGRLVASGMPREDFMRQMDLAIDAKFKADTFTKTQQ